MGKLDFDTNSLDVLAPSSTFRGGEGLAGHYINCSANPHDLRPAADIIVGAAHKMLAELPDDQPLVILMGENHLMPSHKELQHMVASRLQIQGSDFIVGYELPHDTGAFLADNVMEMKVPESLYCDWSSFDVGGQGAASSLLGCYDPIHAPVSSHNVMDFYYENRISMVFNDASADDGFLNLKDPLNSAIVNEYGVTNKKIDQCSPTGMGIRNIVMAGGAVEHAQKNDTRIVLQQTGWTHVFGHAAANLAYEDSLCAVHRNVTGAAILPVFLTSQQDSVGVNSLPENAYVELPTSVVIDGLAEDRFFSRRESVRKNLPFIAEAEKEFIINKLHVASGEELEFYDVEANRTEYQNLARIHADEILSRFAATPN